MSALDAWAGLLVSLSSTHIALRWPAAWPSYRTGCLVSSEMRRQLRMEEGEREEIGSEERGSERKEGVREGRKEGGRAEREGEKERVSKRREGGRG